MENLETTIPRGQVQEYDRMTSQEVSPSASSPAEAQADNGMSIYRRCAPATVEQIMPLVYRLAVNFPAMGTIYQIGNEKISFWTVLGEQLAQLGWSAERTRYAVEYMLRNCKYREFRVAEFLNIDRQVHMISSEEFAAIERSRMPHKPIVVTQVGDAYQMLYKDDADKIGVPYRRKYTTWEASQMSREERKAAGIKWFD